MTSFAHRLFTAAEEGDVLVVIKLLRRIPNIDVNSCGRQVNGHSALSKAAKNGHVEVVRLLLEAGADVNIHDACLVTPLHLAALGGHVEVTKFLLHHGARVTDKAENGMTPMDLAGYGTDSWHVMYQAENGVLPELPERTDVVPLIPWYALTKPPSNENINAPKSKKKEQKKTRK